MAEADEGDFSLKRIFNFQFEIFNEFSKYFSKIFSYQNLNFNY